MQRKRQVGQHLMPTGAAAAGHQRIGCPSISRRGPDVVRGSRVGLTVLTVGLRGGLFGAMGELVCTSPASQAARCAAGSAGNNQR